MTTQTQVRSTEEALSIEDTLKLALEALETCYAGDYSTGHVIDPSFDENAVKKAIIAIKAALEAHKALMSVPDGTQPSGSVERLSDHIVDVNKKVEPPPWWPAVENILNEYGLQAIDFVADFKEALMSQSDGAQPAVTESHKRTWVDMTDEEILGAPDNLIACIAYVRNKLKAKNERKEKNT